MPIHALLDVRVDELNEEDFVAYKARLAAFRVKPSTDLLSSDLSKTKSRAAKPTKLAKLQDEYSL